MQKMTRILIAAVALSIGSALQAAPKTESKPAEIELGAPFRDGAILQRGMKVPVWGWSKPGDTITVEFAGQKKTAKADEKGAWRLELDALEASFEPRKLVVSSSTINHQPSTISNLLVGEVWMASGQSNMQMKNWTRGPSTSYSLKVSPVGEQQVNPIREFEVTSVTSQLFPIKRADGSWKDTDDYKEFSAIAYAFAQTLYTELNVPIGILNCSWSETPIQAWVPREGYETGTDDYTKGIYETLRLWDPRTTENQEAWAAFYQSLEDQLKANEQRVAKGEQPQPVGAPVPGGLGNNRAPTWLFNGRLSPVVPYAIRGAIWNQGYANQHEGLLYYTNLHNLVRGWRLVWNRPDLPVYFHQFYAGAGSKNDWQPSIEPRSEMRLATWMARDIPGAGMVSQIDITGGVHYHNKAVPGIRFALPALKNQYPDTKLKTDIHGMAKAGMLAKDITAEGPMFKGYTVKGDKVIVEFDLADGGLIVAHAYNSEVKEEKGQPAIPKPIANGEDQVKLFSIADENRVWHPATCRIDGSKVMVAAAGVKNPRGVAYATNGAGFVPALYNQALLPMSPFIQYDNQMVTSKDWPAEKLEIAGQTVDPATVGIMEDWRKLPILSTQFRENAVLQAGQPITFWGSTQMWGESGGYPEGKAVIHFQFGDIKADIPVTSDEWQYTVPAMAPTKEPRTLKVSMTIDGELAHERVLPGIVIGDVIYVAAVDQLPQPKRLKPGEVDDSAPVNPYVRVITREAMRPRSERISKYSVATSRTPGPDNRFASYWKKPTGIAAELGNAIAAKTGNPVGIIYMPGDSVPLKDWMPMTALAGVPSLFEDYKKVGYDLPENPAYSDNLRRYMNDWRSFWDNIVQMMVTQGVPAASPWGQVWGQVPDSAPDMGDVKATYSYNVLTASFKDTRVKGIVFLSGEASVEGDQGANFGSEMTALANSWKLHFQGRDGAADAPFIYTMPGKALAPKITRPAGIKGESIAIEVGDWKAPSALVETVAKAVAGK